MKRSDQLALNDVPPRKRLPASGQLHEVDEQTHGNVYGRRVDESLCADSCSAAKEAVSKHSRVISNYESRDTRPAISNFARAISPADSSLLATAALTQSTSVPLTTHVRDDTIPQFTCPDENTARVLLSRRAAAAEAPRPLSDPVTVSINDLATKEKYRASRPGTLLQRPSGLALTKTHLETKQLTSMDPMANQKQQRHSVGGESQFRATVQMPSSSVVCRVNVSHDGETESRPGGRRRPFGLALSPQPGRASMLMAVPSGQMARSPSLQLPLTSSASMNSFNTLGRSVSPQPPNWLDVPNDEALRFSRPSSAVDMADMSVMADVVDGFPHCVDDIVDREQIRQLTSSMHGDLHGGFGDITEEEERKLFLINVVLGLVFLLFEYCCCYCRITFDIL